MIFYWLLEKQTKQGSVYVGQAEDETLFATQSPGDAKTFSSAGEAEEFKNKCIETIAKEFQPKEHGFEVDPKLMCEAVDLRDLDYEQLELRIANLWLDYGLQHNNHITALKNLRAAQAYEQQARQKKLAVLQKIESIFEHKNKPAKG